MNFLKTPILFLVFNRPEETEKVFQSIREVAPKNLYIAADGPRKNKEGEVELCRQVRAIVENVDWECEVKTLFRKENIGCKSAVSQAIIWFFENVEQGIILEDDCLPDQSFYGYCEELLNRYKDEDRIISIGGTNLGYTFNNDCSYGYSRFMNMWGWATWRRSAKLVDYEMQKWQRMKFKKLFLHDRLNRSFFAWDYNWIRFWKNYFDLTHSGQMDTWDYQWIFTQLRYRRLSIFPAKNLVKNIGFSKTATHTFFPDHPISKLPLSSLASPMVHPEDLRINSDYEDNYVKKVWFSYRKQSIYAILRGNFLNNRKVLRVINLFKSLVPVFSDKGR